VLTLRGRFAWAHDYNPDRSIAATFQALPGASFVVNGAAQAHDSALTTASAEMKWLNGWSAAATFEGKFSDVTRSYAGKAWCGDLRTSAAEHAASSLKRPASETLRNSGTAAACSTASVPVRCYSGKLTGE
jgi:Autotransporter beta-domain